MISKYKIILLTVITIFGLLLNYEEKIDSRQIIFPSVSNLRLAFIALDRNSQLLFQSNSWGYPFPYWSKNEFNLKFLFFDLIFYFSIWLIILFVIWLIGAFRRLQERRIKPPKFKF
ncbi:MAG: hypothetical protein N2259_00175 [Patescibacteria group bacterium]|nr:hypothetical protein [Patescibacteria group bacterium]